MQKLQGPAGLTASTIHSVLLRILFSLLMLSSLAAWQTAAAQAIFSNVAVSPTSGTPDASGLLNVTFTGTTQSQYNGDAVYEVDLMEGGTLLKYTRYNVSYNTKTGDPINTPRTFNMTVPLGVGTHQLFLRSFTDWGMDGDSQVFTVTVTAQTNNAAFISQNVPTQMVAGQSYNVSVTLQNNGTKTWVPGGSQPHGLGSQNPADNFTWLRNRVPLSASVAPGGTVTFNFTVTAPGTAGTYNFQWRMVQDGVEWFGALTPNVAVQVIYPQPTASFTIPNEGATYTASGSTATVSFNGTAAPGTGASLSSVQLLETGAVFATGTTSSLSGSKALSVGSHSIELRVTDSRNQVVSVYRNVTVKPAAPTASFTSPASGATFTTAGSTASVPVNATGVPGASASITQMKLYVDGTLFTTSSAATLSSTLTLAAGGHTLEIEAVDNYGTTGPRSSINTVVTSTAGETPVPIVVAVPQLSNTDGGTLPGSVTVSNGTAGYRIGLQLPPGILGMVPNIGLSYDSNSPIGSAGLGWSIDGFSKIDRCGKTMAIDGRNDGVRFLDPFYQLLVDRLCLDGQRLILVNGSATNDADYWADNAEYRTDVESFTRVTAIVSNGKRAFKVETKDGRTSYYGDTVDSYIEGVGRSDGLAHRWYISRTSDRAGNTISYAYNEDTVTGETKPATVQWGGNTTLGTPHFAKVSFTYEARKDPRTSYVAGSVVSENLRLQRVDTSVDNSDNGAGVWTPALNYTLAYTTSPSSGRSLLNSVTACDASRCLPPTIFNYGEPNSAAPRAFQALGGMRSGPNFQQLARNPELSVTPMDEVAVADFNGDGKTDIIERDRVAGNQYQQHLYQSNGDGTGWTVSTPLINVADSALKIYEIGDFDGDGLTDLMVANFASFAPTNWRLCLGSRRISGNYQCDVPLSFPQAAIGPTVLGHLVADFNADGKDDFAIQASDGPWNHSFQCLSNGTGFACTEVTGTRDEISFTENRDAMTSAGSVSADVDGDGRVDTLLLSKCVWEIAENERFPRWHCGDGPFGDDAGGITVYNHPERGGVYFSSGWNKFPNKTTGILPQMESGSLTADLNADGYTDMVFGSVEMTSAGSLGTFSGRICTSRGNGGADCRNLPASSFPNRDHLVMTLGDFDGDGVYDVLRPSNDAWAETNVTGYLLCHVGTDRDLGVDPLFHRCETWSGPTFYALSQQSVFSGSSGMGSGTQSMFLGDFDGDGKQDIANYLNNGQWQIYSAANQAKPNEALDRLVTVTNGVGNIEKIDYGFANDPSVYQPTVARPDGQNAVGKLTYPTRPLVKAVHKGNGLGTWRDTTYTYARMAMESGGRGNLGFAQVTSTESQRGITRTVWPCLSYPQIGAECGSREVSVLGVTLSSTVNEWSSRSFTYASGGRTNFPYLSKSTATRRDPSDYDLGKVVVTTALPDAWGNVLDTVAVSSSDTNPTGWTVHKVMVYNNDSGTWRLGELASVTETRSNDYNTISRTNSYTYTTQGLLDTAVRESSDLAQKLTTKYDRSTASYGLIGKTILSWTDANGNPKTRTVSDVTYTPNGRFVSSVKNAVGHVEQRSFDARTGSVTNVIAADGLSTATTSDGFGRVLSVTTPDGTIGSTSYKSCSANCPAGATTVAIQETKRAGDVRVAVPVLLFADSAGHAVRTQTWGFDGRKVISDTVFDYLGRVQKVYWPRYATDTEALAAISSDPSGAILQTQTIYDEWDRPTSVKTLDELGNQVLTMHMWRGFKHETTNPKQYLISETRDVWGKLSSTVDANGKTTAFAFDAFGNLARTTDPVGNVVKVTYDDWGRRRELRDPDLGLITFDVDPLGQTWREISPKQRAGGKATVTVFDDLGRMVSRNAEDSNANWTYDVRSGQAGCAAYHSCGKLVASNTVAGATAIDFREEYNYDAIGRPDTTTTWLDVAYTSRQRYDAWGRPVSEQHQRGSDPVKMYDRRYNAWGQLARIERAGQPLWTATAQDAAHRITASTLGNGLAVSMGYNPYTGRLATGGTSGGQGTLLQEAYQYDVLGNVSQRLQQWGGTSFTENFEYDQMNRLHTATMVGYAPQVFNYDDIGNITSKTGVGSGNYAYPVPGVNSVRPHAVSSIPGVGTFDYDVNGNMTSGAGRTISWSSFDMPVTIGKGAATSTFYYGADRQRVKQVRSDGVTMWYAGGTEVEVGSASTTVKTYLPNGLGVEVDKAGTTQLYYMHHDRLGSVMALSNQSGSLVENLAYDSWGKRRELATPNAPENIDGSIDNKGFTGHEMLDQLDLVHMNGRVYDPLIARFVSADPFVQDAHSSQSYNRYSYVWNNPTNLVDPSGFVAMGWGSSGRGFDGSIEAESSGQGEGEAHGNRTADHTGVPQTIGKVIVSARRICQPCERMAWEIFLRERETALLRFGGAVATRTLVGIIILMPGNMGTRARAGEMTEEFKRSINPAFTPAQIEAMRKDSEEEQAGKDGESVSAGTGSDENKNATDEAIADLTNGLPSETDKRGRSVKGHHVNETGNAESDLENLPGQTGKNGQKTLPDGSTAGVHTSTTTGAQTLHIHRPTGSQDIKIRYPGGKQ